MYEYVTEFSDNCDVAVGESIDEVTIITNDVVCAEQSFMNSVNAVFKPHVAKIIEPFETTLIATTPIATTPFDTLPIVTTPINSILSILNTISRDIKEMKTEIFYLKSSVVDVQEKTKVPMGVHST